MEFGDILIPFDETGPRDFLIDESEVQKSDMPDGWEFPRGFSAEHLVEVSICLRPISPKLVYEVSDISHDGLPFLLVKIAVLFDESQRTYRDRQNDQEFSYPPNRVRTARYLGPAHCVSEYRIRRWRLVETDFDARFEFYGQEIRFEEKNWKDYTDARAAGLCRPLNIDIV
ncbi:HET domain-containing protein [Colletotrichum abscissum]|uniref:HET domain-containing protein n=1 Tax=Colletotrichum abscissum TaxID=1671311 RepID=A0A9P9X417_9PEZI|nr:HET domain-containing protein [Colletotrichum abscissum]